MVPKHSTNRRIQPRHDDSEEEYVSEDDGNKNTSPSSESGAGSQSGSNHDEDANTDSEQDSVVDESDAEVENLKDISFGALAKAQSSYSAPSTSRKRKFLPQHQPNPTTTPSFNTTDNPHPTHSHLSSKPKQDLSARTSKHAPQVLSSRHPVSRARTIFEPAPVQKSRDPRFDPTITSRTLNQSSIAAASKAYSFLSEYQASEILTLKAEIKKTQTKDPTHAAELKKKVMSMESRLRNAEAASKEREVLAKHRAQEKQAIKEGKKARPYFLKKSDVRKEVERERVEGLNKRQKDKMEKRKRMREKRKEARDMPWARRMG